MAESRGERMQFSKWAINTGACLLAFAALSFSRAEAARVTGTAFAITSDGYVITCFHVIEDARSITLTDTNGRTYVARLLRGLKAMDLALLKIEGQLWPLPIGNSDALKRGQSVFTIGFPNVDVQGREPKITDGIISSLSGIRDDSRVVQISVPVQPGNSGGPLIDQFGNVVGVVASKLSPLYMLDASGDIPTNVAYAIKAAKITDIIAAFPEIRSKLAKPARGRPQSLTSLIGASEKAILLVTADNARLDEEVKRDRERQERETQEEQRRADDARRQAEQARRDFEANQKQRQAFAAEMAALQARVEQVKQAEAMVRNGSEALRSQSAQIPRLPPYYQAIEQGRIDSQATKLMEIVALIQVERAKLAQEFADLEQRMRAVR